MIKQPLMLGEVLNPDLHAVLQTHQIAIGLRHPCQQVLLHLDQRPLGGLLAQAHAIDLGINLAARPQRLLHTPGRGVLAGVG